MDAILLVSAGVIILLVGGGLGFWAGRSGIGGSQARVEKAEAELEDYKRSVTEHFGQTAAHFQAIGKQYRDLYEHMSSGAQALCEPDAAGKQLQFALGADSSSTNLKEPVTEAVAEEELRPPVDFAESPIETEAAEAREAADGPADEQDANMAGEAETGVAEGDVSETAAESQPEAKAEEGQRTIH